MTSRPNLRNLQKQRKGAIMDDTKECLTCEEEKPLTDFYTLKNKSRMTAQLSSYCRLCSRIRAYTVKRELTDNNFQKLWEYFTKNPCVDCGEDNPIVLSLDHIRPGKSASISDLCGRVDWSKVENELTLCESRCHNCHAIKTAASRDHYKTEELRTYLNKWELNEQAYEEYK